MTDADELFKLRYALLYWNYDKIVIAESLRDRVAALIEKCETDRPYHWADIIIAEVMEGYQRMDQTLYDVIPEDEWEIKLE